MPSLHPGLAKIRRGAPGLSQICVDPKNLQDTPILARPGIGVHPNAPIVALPQPIFFQVNKQHAILNEKTILHALQKKAR